ncbi:PaaI family thioesterase [Salinibaculum rarum]|uniref:PaaI family thioesterase n=1 Tax=Salinibaculum rarum TaxID=3058903 RepID=UPI00265FDF01|nr:PaaI family thioesterase [Salinibaculum sp. KK48]
MSDNTSISDDGETDSLTADVEQRKLKSVEEYFNYLRESNPYYSWLDPEILTVDRGVVQLRQPTDERTQPPEVGPADGINGGILMTLADAAGMAAIITEALEPIPLATTQLNMSFHDGADEPHIIQAEVLDFGSTLATAQIKVLPESDLNASEPRLFASGEATARLFQ